MKAISKLIRRWEFIVAVLGLFIGICSLLVMIYFGIKSIKSKFIVIQSNIAEVGDRVKAVEKAVLAVQFTITNPVNEAAVSMTELVRGKTPFSKMNHYIVVTPLKTGGDLVQDRPVKISTAGSWSGRARFAAADVGAGERFIVRVLATKSTLSPGSLTEVPEDAVFSNSIIVTREK